MDPDRWRLVREIFDAAVALPAGERADFVQERCAGDPVLLEEVESLLSSHEEAGTFIDRPAVDRVEGLEALTSESPGMPPPGTLVGRYRLERLLGSGGMGSVFLAVRADDEYRQRVAVKLLRSDLMTPELARRFRSERQILADLDHPNIARLLDGGTTADGRPYLVMEHVEGEPLDLYCDRRRLSTAERLRLFRKICAAVHFAHQSLVVHRDLKPGNILVTEAGEPKLLDFGIAKLLAEGADAATVGAPTLDHTGTGLAPMTPEYASPEQVRGESITTASDVYSLGVLLYDLLTGHRPYYWHRRSALEILRAVCEEDPGKPSTAVLQEVEVPTTGGGREVLTPKMVSAARAEEPRSLHRRLTGDLDNIVLMALRKDPQRRYSSAEQLAADVERYLTGMPVHARQETLTYVVGKFVRRHAAAVTAATLALVLLVGFLITLLVQRQQILRQSARATEISNFLVELFEVSEPSRARGEAITAREILDRGARRIDRRLEDQPGLKADLQQTISRVYQKLGLYPEALVHAEAALEARKEGRREAEARARSLLQLGDLRLDVGDYPAAAAAFRQSLEIFSRHRGHAEARVLALIGLGRALQLSGDLAAAAPLYRQALETAENELGERDPLTASSYDHLAGLLLEGGGLEAAEEHTRRSLDLYRQLHGEDHPRVAEVMDNLAQVLARRGDYEAAEPLYRQALKLQRSILEPDHPAIASTLHHLANLLHDSGRYGEGLAAATEALTIRRRALGDEHPKVASTLNNLGQLHRELGDLEAAEVRYREALEIWRQQLGDDHPEVGVGLNNLAQVLRRRGELAAAEDLYRQTLEIYRRAYGDDHEDVATVLNNLGGVARAQGDGEAAERSLREAMEILERTLGADHPKVALARQNLGGLLWSRGELEAAEGLQRQALDSLLASVGSDHPHAALVRHSLALTLFDLDRPEDAEEAIRQALVTYRRELPDDHPWILDAVSLQGACLAAQGRLRAAEPLLRDSHRQLLANLGADSDFTRRSRARLDTFLPPSGEPLR